VNNTVGNQEHIMNMLSIDKRTPPSSHITKILTACVLVAAIPLAPHAQQAGSISSFDSCGMMTLFGYQAGTTATVEWASSLTDPHRTNWNPLSLVIVTNLSTSTEWPLFFRVKGIPDTQTPPDYRSAYYWVMRDDNPDKPFDVFFMHPTSYFTTNTGYNASFFDEAVRPATDITTQTKVSVFESTCNIYAPRYRQVSIVALTMPPEDTGPYYQVAESDMLDAFNYYIDHCNNGRPYFLASHSQGSDLMLRFFRKHRDLIDNHLFVGAYCPGWTFTDNDLEDINIPLAVSSTQLGGLVTWNTIGVGGLSPTLLPGARCINPLAWTPATNEAPASMNICAVIYLTDGTVTNIPNFTSAYIDNNGGLVIPTPDAIINNLSMSMGTNVYHSYDYAFFYSNIVENIALRCTTWSESGEDK
jgi:hypothetical protein